MRALPNRIWQEFQSAVAGLSDNAPLEDVLSVMLLWIRSNHRLFSGEPFSIYGFDEIEEIDERAMPVRFTSFDMAHFKKVILKREAKDAEAIARFLRDSVEELISIEVDEMCPNCESEGMRVFIGRDNGLLAYQCKVCGFAHYSDGSRVEVGGLGFARVEQLRELGLIK